MFSLSKSRDRRAKLNHPEPLETRALLATFVVTNANNSGTGSFRTAIENANANNGDDSIVFNIPASQSKSIGVTAPLPAITDTVLIDGWSQPGFVSNPLIVLNGQAAGNVRGLDIRADSTVVRGLVVQNFGNDGIRLRGVTNVKIQGNFVGTTLNGLGAAGNGDEGIQLDGNASGNLIGSDGDGSQDALERNIVAASTDDGILVYGGSNNVIAGNYVGVGIDGLTALGNGDNGIIIDTDNDNNIPASQNTIGGDSVAERNVVSGNLDDGVLLWGSSDNTVIGNYIGVGADGATPVPNAEDGIILGTDNEGSAASNNVIGGPTAALRNVISGNTDDGITVFGASGTTIAGNYIGVAADGVTPVGNDDGISITANNNNIGSGGTIIGGATTAHRNVIGGNRDDGIQLFQSNTTATQIRNNYIGVGANGTTTVGNVDNGIGIFEAVSSIIDSNVISGNQNDGIDIADGASGTSVTGNRIGTNPAGTAAIPNTWRGIQIRSGSKNNVIGGTTSTARNIISGNGNHGILLRDADTDNNRIRNNFIGVNLAGDAAIANGSNGVLLFDGPRNNFIGGSANNEGNVISGNRNDGIEVHSSTTINNMIQGNLIGTDSTGIVALGNGSDGVEFDGAGPNLLGGTTTGARNVISGNISDGVEVWRAAQGQTIQGNFIGVGSNGVTPLGNQRDGITISGGSLQGNPPTVSYIIDVSGSTNDTFAGTSVGDVNGDNRVNSILDAELAGFIEFTTRLHNMGFGNDVTVGITVFGSSGVALDMDPIASGTQLTTFVSADENNNGTLDIIDVLRPIRSGWMGANAGGTSFPNALNRAIDTFTTLGTRSGDGNIIFVSDGENGGGNNFGAQLTELDGLGVKRLAVGMGSDSRLTQLELIDPQATLVTSTDEFSNTLLAVLGLNPGQSGQQTVVGTNVTVGGTVAGAGNVIAYNGRDGVDVTNFLAVGNSILGNSIHDNTRLGINLGHRDVTPNDSADADSGANQLTNFPSISSVVAQSSQHRVSGTLEALPNETYRVEFFGSGTVDPSGHGEGRDYLGHTSVTTNANGFASFNPTYALPHGSSWVTATATDSENNTSEFSAAVQSGGTSSTFTVADVSVDEDAGTLNFEVELDQTLDIDVNVRMTFTNGTATGGVDFNNAALEQIFSANSSASRTFSVPIIDDSVVENSETFVAALSTTTNLGTRSVDLSDTAVGTILDNDAVGADFRVTESNGGTVVPEDGTIDSFTVVLTRQPATNVVITISSSDNGEAMVTPASLTFTPQNWNAARIVNVTGIDDGFVDGDQSVTLTLSIDDNLSDSEYRNLPDKTLDVLVEDSQAPGADDYADAVIRYAPLHSGGPGPTHSSVQDPQAAIGAPDYSSVGGNEQGYVTLGRGGLLEVEFIDNRLINSGSSALDLQIFEVGGDVETTIVSLRPTPATVALLPASSDSDGDGFYLIGPINGGTRSIDIDSVFTGFAAGSLVFDAVQLIDDRNQGKTVGEFVGADIDAVLALSTDSVAPDVIIAETNNSTRVDESGTTDTFSITLNQRPDSNVVLSVSSNDTGEATVNRSTLTFTPSNWNTAQEIVVTGRDDSSVDGSQMSTITVSVIDASSDDAFDPISDKSVSVTTTDNDMAATPTQFVRSSADTMTVAPGTFLDIPVFYETQNFNGVPTALRSNLFSFNLHFDANQLTFVQASSATIFNEGIQVVPNVVRSETDPTVTGNDLNSATESVLVAAYSDHDSAVAPGWPNQHSSNARQMYVARFRVNNSFTDSVINFTHNATGAVTGQAQEFGFGSTSIDLVRPQTLPTLSIADATGVSEGQPAQFTVTLSEALDSEITVQYSTAMETAVNAATIGSDLIAQTGQVLRFLPGETTKNVIIQTTDDSSREATETFLVEISVAIGATISDGTAIGSIIDNDDIVGDIDGDDDFDANDAFLMHLVKLSGSELQIDQAKGTSPLTAAQIRANIQALGTAVDVDGDNDFDANDSFLIQLIKLAGSDAQIDQSKGVSLLTAAQIRGRVDDLDVQAQAFSRSVVASLVVSGGPANEREERLSTIAVAENDSHRYEGQLLSNTDAGFASAKFREWLDAI